MITKRIFLAQQSAPHPCYSVIFLHFDVTDKKNNVSLVICVLIGNDFLIPMPTDPKHINYRSKHHLSSIYVSIQTHFCSRNTNQVSKFKPKFYCHGGNILVWKFNQLYLLCFQIVRKISDKNLEPHIIEGRSVLQQTES